MKKLLLAALLLMGSSAVAAPLVKVVAVVNNDVVTSYQLDKQLTLTMVTDTDKRRRDKEEYQKLRREVLDKMIEDLLAEQRIRELGLTVSEQELDTAIADVQRQNKLTLDQLKSALKAQGMSYADYRENLRKEILRYKLVGREVRSKVEVTRQQIRDYFSAHEADYRVPPTLHLTRISYPLDKKSDAKTRERFAQQLQIARRQLLDGKPFAEVLNGLEGKPEGGDMGTLVEKEMNPQLQKVVANLSAGQVSEPQEAFGSLQIFQVTERTPAHADLTPEISKGIEKILATQNGEKRLEEWKKELRKDAVIDIRL